MTNPIDQLLAGFAELHKDVWTNKTSLKRGDVLSKPGYIDTNLYFIDSGTIRAFQLINEEEVTIRFGYGGEVIVALDSFLTNCESKMTLQALKRTEVLSLNKSAFFDFVHSDIRWQKLWTEILHELVIQQLEREIDLLIDSPLGRYQRVLERSPRLFQEVPAKYIASYLRMSPETLSRLR